VNVDPATLSAPDKYFLEVSKVQNMGPRLECMLTKNTFAKKAETINTVRPRRHKMFFPWPMR
jgi:hypothetical protein